MRPKALEEKVLRWKAAKETAQHQNRPEPLPLLNMGQCAAEGDSLGAGLGGDANARPCCEQSVRALSLRGP